MMFYSPDPATCGGIRLKKRKGRWKSTNVCLTKRKGGWKSTEVDLKIYKSG